MNDSPFQLSEDEVWGSLETLYGEGKVDHVAGIGSDVKPGFTLTDEGIESAREVLRENDGALGMMLQLAVENAEPGEEPAAIVSMAKQIRDDVGVNVFRRLRAHRDDIPAIDFEGLPEHFYDKFDP